MLNLSGIPIKERFSNEVSYKEFRKYLADFYFRIVNNYSFLGIKENQWNNLFRNMVIKNLNGKETDLYYLVVKDIKFKVKEVIGRAMNNGKVGLFDNLVGEILEKEESSTRAFKTFVSKIRDMEIQFSENYYNLLKRESRNFRFLLTKLGISDFDKAEYDNYIMGKYDAYASVLSRNKGIREIMPVVEYFYGLLGVAKQDILVYYHSLSAEELRKVALLVGNVEVLEEIYKLYVLNVQNTTKLVFDKAITNMELNDIMWLLSEYNKYKLAESKDLTFIIRLRNRVERIKNVMLPTESKAVLKKKSSFEFNPLLCDYFELYKGVSSEIRENIIRDIFNHFKDETKFAINEQIAKDLEKKKKTIIPEIASMRFTYKKYFRYYFTPYQNIYEAVEIAPELPVQKKKEFVDFYLSCLAEEKQKNIKRFLTGDITLSVKESSLAAHDFSVVKKQVLFQQDLFLNNKSLIDFIGDETVMSEDVKTEIMYNIWRTFDELKKEHINIYLNGLKPLTPKDKARARNYISSFNNAFLRYIVDVKTYIALVGANIKESVPIEVEEEMSFDEMYKIYQYLVKIQEELVQEGKMTLEEYNSFRNNCFREIAINKGTSSVREILENYMEMVMVELQSTMVNSL